MTVQPSTLQFGTGYPVKKNAVFSGAQTVRIQNPFNPAAQDQVQFSGGRAPVRRGLSGAFAALVMSLSMGAAPALADTGPTPTPPAATSSAAPSGVPTASAEKAADEVKVDCAPKAGSANGAMQGVFQPDFETVLAVLKQCDITALKMDNGAGNADPVYEIVLENGSKYWFFAPTEAKEKEGLKDLIADKNLDVQYTTIDTTRSSPLIGAVAGILQFMFMMALIGGVIYLINRRTGFMSKLFNRGGAGGGGNAWNEITNTNVRFNSVGGYPEVLEQLKEILARYEANIKKLKNTHMDKELAAQQKIADNPMASSGARRKASKRVAQLEANIPADKRMHANIAKYQAILDNPASTQSEKKDAEKRIKRITALLPEVITAKLLEGIAKQQAIVDDPEASDKKKRNAEKEIEKLTGLLPENKAARIQKEMDEQRAIVNNPSSAPLTRWRAASEIQRLRGEMPATVSASETVEENREDEFEIEVDPTTGVMFYGGPGTGKSLMAEAVAGEAGVPFFSVSGSDFVRKYVGTGAENVDKMFKAAKKKADQHGGCIIFIDEVDSIAGQRGDGAESGGDQERASTLNKLLACMSGPEADDRILWIVATNRKDMLDDAFVRAGRIEDHIEVTAPKEVKGRMEILMIYAQKYIDKGQLDVSALDYVAQVTSGMSGAELKKIINEAGVFANKMKKKVIDQECFAEAILKTSIGIALDSLTVPPGEHARVMAHEGYGHALAALVEPIGLDLFTVSARPRGPSMGHVSYSPEKLSKYLTSRDEAMKLMLIAAGGRAAEEVFYGGRSITGGWGGDLDNLKQRFRGLMALGLLKKDIVDATDPRSGMPIQDREFRTEVIDLAVATHRRLVELVPPEERAKGLAKLMALGKRELIGEEATRFMKEEVFADYPWEEAAKIVGEYLNTSFDDEPLYESGVTNVASASMATSHVEKSPDPAEVSAEAEWDNVRQGQIRKERRHLAPRPRRRSHDGENTHPRRVKHAVGDGLHKLADRLTAGKERPTAEN